MTTTLTQTNGNGNAGGTPPTIHLYTNHRCPWAHRVHIVLAELGLPFEETIIDLDTPRPQWYLDINPRGLVPSIKYTVPGVLDEEILTESGVVASFLADTFPSPLLPASHGSPLAPLERARVSFFVDTFLKLLPQQMTVLKAAGAEKEAAVEEWVKAVEKEIEPLLANAAPFFGGSKELTLAEALTAPFVVRWFAFAEDGRFVPASLGARLEGLKNFGPWCKAVRERGSVTEIFDGAGTVEAFVKKYGSGFGRCEGK